MIATMTRVAWKRALRGRGLLLALAMAALPIPFAWWMRGDAKALSHQFSIQLVVLAVVPTWFVAGSIGEELDQRSAAYLWSRPIARWKIVASKLLALAPLAIALSCASWMVAFEVGRGRFPARTSIEALAACTLAVAFVSAGIAALAPRQGMALAIVYTMFDIVIGQLPMALSLKAVSITYHGLVIARFAPERPDATNWITLAAISFVWLAGGLLRLKNRES